MNRRRDGILASASKGVSAPFGLLAALASGWTWQMAWRESRSSRRRLILFSCSIVLGIAALTAIGSLGANLRRGIEEQARTLLGADLVIGSRQAFSTEEEALFHELGGEQSHEESFSSMIYFPASGGTRLVQVRALEGGFPYYGQLETAPAGAAASFRQTGGALVDQTLLTQFDARPGDAVKLGKLTITIAGALKSIPGESVAFSSISPRVYIPMRDLPATDLVKPGSLVRYRVYFRFGLGTEVSSLVKRIKPRLDALRLSYSTVEQRKENLGRSLDNMYHFLNLVGFIALLLGGVGVGSAIHVHVKQKLTSAAVLRCLGASVSQAFAIYLAQGMALGLFGAVLGAVLGLGVQALLPSVLGEFIPFSFEFAVSWVAVARSMGIGFVICLLFALLPLLALRRISPLAAIRASFDPPKRRDPLRWLAGLCIALGILAFALAQGGDWRVGAGFTAGLGVVFGLLALLAKGLVVLSRRAVPRSLPFAWRQGLANLHRPNNRTLLLLLSLGLGTFLMLTIFLVQETLLTQLVSEGGKTQANTVLFDVQPDQREGVSNLLHQLHLPVLDDAPIVTMRLAALKGRTVESLLTNKGVHIPHWTLRREYRSTYNDRLRDAEKVIAGTFYARVTNDAAIPISVEKGIATELEIGIGDEVIFDVQGIPVTTRVASLREVNWRRIQPNFFVVFPRGVLEDAPSMHVLVTRAGSSDESARLQRETVQAFPNVSIIDLSLILHTLDSILGKISFVVRFMAMFTVLTGLLVLIGALLIGRYQRIQESVLLRTIGASRGQILRILFVEYLALGLLAAFTGVLLAVAASWALAEYVFKVAFAFHWTPMVVAVVSVPTLTILVGFLMSRGILNQSPLSVLRAEA